MRNTSSIPNEYVPRTGPLGPNLADELRVALKAQAWWHVNRKRNRWGKDHSGVRYAQLQIDALAVRLEAIAQAIDSPPESGGS